MLGWADACDGRARERAVSACARLPASMPLALEPAGLAPSVDPITVVGAAPSDATLPRTLQGAKLPVAFGIRT